MFDADKQHCSLSAKRHISTEPTYVLRELEGSLIRMARIFIDWTKDGRLRTGAMIRKRGPVSFVDIKKSNDSDLGSKIKWKAPSPVHYRPPAGDEVVFS